LAAIACAGLACADAAAAECRRAPEADAYPALVSEAAGPTDSDRAGRMVAPILVNGEGPFRFIIDTGANRSVLSGRLAQRLGLTPSGDGEVHSVYGVAPAPFVRVTSLHYGDLSLPSGELPILQGPVLAGEHGLLGVDGMEGRRLELDFRRGCIEIGPSRHVRRVRGWVSVRGELRFGHLVVVPGRISGLRVNVLIDTGSDTSLANTALQEALGARLSRNRSLFGRAATASDPIMLERAIILRRLFVGDMEAQNVTAFVGDYHVFSLWGMLEEPTLLLGMDVLTQARALAIDYGRATVSFRIG
jgi:predicted aspartyl protease